MLRDSFADASVDLIYLDPPFNSDQNYYLTNSAEENEPQAFKDRWRWDDKAETALIELKRRGENTLADFFTGVELFLGKSPLLVYLTMMGRRLVELRRVLKNQGSIYLHCDQNASAHLRLLMDAVFGTENYLNTIVWCYGLGGSSARRWPRKHDDILWYSRQPHSYYFEPDLIPAASQRMKGKSKKAPDYWIIPTINNMAKERCGWPTQKPLALLERIIRSSSRPGDVALDPFCGSGTTLEAALRLGRKAAGIDNSSAAIELTQRRLLRILINYSLIE